MRSITELELGLVSGGLWTKNSDGGLSDDGTVDQTVEITGQRPTNFDGAFQFVQIAATVVAGGVAVIAAPAVGAIVGLAVLVSAAAGALRTLSKQNVSETDAETTDQYGSAM